jgi:hypothetical protein
MTSGVLPSFFKLDVAYFIQAPTSEFIRRYTYMYSVFGTVYRLGGDSGQIR